MIIGSGNVATVMGRKLAAAGHHIVQVAGRNAVSVQKLGALLDCTYTTDFTTLKKDAGLYLIAIPDDALYHIGDWLHTGYSLTVHTAGSLPRDVLKKVSSRIGVFYPLQSLRADVVQIPEIPMLIDANSEDATDELMQIAKSISGSVQIAGDEYRKKIQLAAVISGNFSNHLFAITERYCREESIEFSMLMPLLNETVHRMTYYPAGDVQTGPARRHDMGTITNHLHMLERHPDIKKLYAMMTDAIMEHYTNTANT